MQKKENIIRIEGLEIPYEIQYKGVKNISLRFRDQRFIVSAPYGTSVSYIEGLITSHLGWYLKTKNRVEKRADTLATDDHLLLWGRRFALIYREGSRRIVFSEDTCTVYYPTPDYERYLKDQLKKIMMREVDSLRGKYDSIMDDYHLLHPTIRYREMTSRWGSCMSRKATIHLNTRLVHYPKKCLDYVLLHEYMHFIEPNHSKSFHALLKYYMPDYKEAEAQLR